MIAPPATAHKIGNCNKVNTFNRITMLSYMFQQIAIECNRHLLHSKRAIDNPKNNTNSGIFSTFLPLYFFES